MKKIYRKKILLPAAALFLLSVLSLNTKAQAYLESSDGIDGVLTAKVLYPPSNFNAFYNAPNVELTWDENEALGDWLHWDDGVNSTSLGLTDGGTFWGAAKWDSIQLQDYEAWILTRFAFFPHRTDYDSYYKLMIWEGVDASALVYEQVLSELDYNEWNTIYLDEPHFVDASKELWVGFEVTHLEGEHPLGTDAGPAVAGYGDMYTTNGSSWISLSSYGYGNFNIQIFLSDTAAGMKHKQILNNKKRNGGKNAKLVARKHEKVDSPVLMPKQSEAIKYNCYRNGILLNPEPIENTNFTDLNPPTGIHSYTVKAVYPDGLSEAAGPVNVAVGLNNRQVWHISTAGNDILGNGSEGFPFATIQHGIYQASNGDTVLVASGTYNENIDFAGKNIIVGSHYILNNDPSTIEQTVIEGIGNEAIVTFNSGETADAKITGFTINGANLGNISAGIVIIDAYPLVSHMIISNITSSNIGGGIYLENSSSEIAYNKITANSAVQGAGLYVSFSDDAIIHHNDILNNVTIGAGAGGGIYCYNSNSNIHHNLIAENESEYGAGIQCNTESSPLILNNTIVNNIGSYGGGMRCRTNSSPKLVNNIFWGNTGELSGAQISLGDPESIPYIYYCDIEGGTENFGLSNGAIFNGTFENCIDSDPLFNDPENSDFFISINSPCIDTGDPTQPEDPDLSVSDMGYQYYHQDFVAAFIADNTYDLPTFEVNFTDLSTGNPTTWAWDLNGNGSIDSYDQNPSWLYEDFGVYTVTLTISNAENEYTRTKTDYVTADYKPGAIISSIDDVPNDQGGKVYVEFARSIYDTDTLQDWPAGYNLEMNTGYGWISITSVGAYGADSYIAMCNTPFDSSQYSNGLIDFRVIAIMEEGNFASATSQGYSVDNLAPAVPDGMDYELLANEITINWNTSPAQDFAYFAVYKSDVSGVFTQTPFATSTLAAFADQLAEGEVAYYVVTATDFHGNESGWSEEVETSPAMRWELKEGWSGISSFIDPSDADIENMFAGIQNELIILQNDDGIYWPGQNVNTLGSWDKESGYKIKIAEDVNLSISGSRLENQNLSMAQSWNLMPVLSECPTDVAELFATNDVEIVKEVAGWKVYWPEFSINTLGELEPGKAYFTLMSSEEEIVFPECDGIKTTTGTLTGFKTLSELAAWNLTKPSAISHIVAIPATENINLVLAYGDIIGVFDQSDFCYGTIEWTGVNTALTAFGNDPLTYEKDGFDPGETLIFKSLSLENEHEQILDVRYNSTMPQSDAFAENGLSAISSIKAEATGIETPGQVQQLQIHPNPTHDTFTLSLELAPQSKGSLELYNLKGQLMMKVEIRTKSTQVEIQDLPTGVYIATILIDNQTLNKQLLKH